MKTAKWILMALICFFVAASAAGAHMLWLTPDKHSPAPGDAVTVTLGFGHHFSPDEVMEKEDRMERVYAVSPDGTEIDLKAVTPSQYTFTPETEGPYAMYATMKSGCMSTTTTGRKMGNRKTLEGVVSCFGFEMSAMTTVRCGGGAGTGFGKEMLTVDIIPQKNPATIKTGDTLPLLVMYQGKPLAGATLSAVGEGCKLAEDQSWDQEVETNADGVAQVGISVAGPWLFSVRHKIPYADPEACDDMMYSTTLTLDF